MKKMNFERYKDEVLHMINENRTLALSKGKFVNCRSIHCMDCDWYGGDGCFVNAIKWFYKESKIVLIEEEHKICKLVKDGYLVRNEDGKLYYHQNKPHKTSSYWFCSGEDSDTCICLECFNYLFEFIKWEDDEPWDVKDLNRLGCISKS